MTFSLFFLLTAVFQSPVESLPTRKRQKNDLVLHKIDTQKSSDEVSKLLKWLLANSDPELKNLETMGIVSVPKDQRNSRLNIQSDSPDEVFESLKGAAPDGFLRSLQVKSKFSKISLFTLRVLLICLQH